MRNTDSEQLFAKWLDNTLTDNERQQFETLRLQDEAFSARVQGANMLREGADQFDAADVPDWDRESTFFRRETSRWWQWSGLPVMSMAVSACALVLVVTGFKVNVADGEVTLGFGHGMSNAQVDALVAKRVENLEQTSQTLFTRYADALAAQQQQSSAELTQYLLSSSRKERREDFAELIKFINEQRSDDQRFYVRQINDLQQEINTLGGTYSPDLVPQEQSME